MQAPRCVAKMYNSIGVQGCAWRSPGITCTLSCRKKIIRISGRAEIERNDTGGNPVILNVVVSKHFASIAYLACEFVKNFFLDRTAWWQTRQPTARCAIGPRIVCWHLKVRSSGVSGAQTLQTDWCSKRFRMIWTN